MGVEEGAAASDSCSCSCSGSGASRTMEEIVVKRSIRGCLKSGAEKRATVLSESDDVGVPYTDCL